VPEFTNTRRRMYVAIGVATVRQDEAIASSSCNCVLVSSVKSSLNTSPKCSILRSNHTKFSVAGICLLPRPVPQREGVWDPFPTPHPSQHLGRLD